MTESWNEKTAFERLMIQIQSLHVGACADMSITVWSQGGRDCEYESDQVSTGTSGSMALHFQCLHRRKSASSLHRLHTDRLNPAFSEIIELSASNLEFKDRSVDEGEQDDEDDFSLPGKKTSCFSDTGNACETARQNFVGAIAQVGGHRATLYWPFPCSARLALELVQIASIEQENACLNYWTCSGDTFACYYPSVANPGTWNSCSYSASADWALAAGPTEICTAKAGVNLKCEPGNDPHDIGDQGYSASYGFISETNICTVSIDFYFVRGLGTVTVAEA
ncbi:uncharacterized protein F5891DRAFT_974597 [Suillus fuscotomentosus]|uniref:Uncharacterized protein n=1 Tax=Suillus fuscotomentosus TaxID=1912939 RepID=A0AAD4HT38_9AGAM|nr:uncharacterized protein F5891DRAFT_974597 [Suillus fuscotomentosus]KAG1908008.1 hypothetical protein F5891DRAFT_974597 [Suillus fuscotomentosus]